MKQFSKLQSRPLVRLFGIDPLVGAGEGERRRPSAERMARRLLENAVIAEANRVLASAADGLDIWSHPIVIRDRKLLLTTRMLPARTLPQQKGAHGNGASTAVLPPRLLIEVSDAPQALSARTVMVRRGERLYARGRGFATLVKIAA